MKVLFAHRYDPAYPLGGAAHVVRQLAIPMKERLEGIACAVNRGDLADLLRREGLQVYEIPWPRMHTIKLIRDLKAVVGSFRPNVIHTHHRYLTFLLDLFFKKDCRILHTEHVLRHDKRCLFRYGHHATAVSESVRKNLIEYYHVPKDRVTLIPNAVSLRTVHPQALDRLKKKFRTKPEEFLAVCVGRLDEQKGHLYLVKAISQLPEPYRRRIKVLVIGEGKLKAMLLDEVCRLGVDANFSFLGYTGEVPELLRLSDFFVLPSLWEGMPLSVLEAYQAGKPVIATDIPGTREVVQQGKTGILVPPRDSRALGKAIQEWMDHPEHMTAMKQGIAERAGHFSFSKLIERYQEVYQMVLR